MRSYDFRYRFKIKIINFHQSNDVWERFYPETIVSNHITDNTTEVYGPGQYFIDSILFKDFDEGVIRVSNPNSDTKYLVSQCIFINPHYKINEIGEGGAIYMESSENGGSFVEYRVCSIGAQTDEGDASSGTYSYIITARSDNYKNWMLESTVSNNLGGYATVLKGGGSHNIYNVNLSFTVGAINSVYNIGSDTTTYLNFSTIYKAHSLENTCNYHSGNTHEVNHCNYIKNTVEELALTYGIYFGSGDSLNIKFCVFESNECNYLFHSWYSPITVDKCYISESNKYDTIATTSVTTKDLSYPMIFIDLSHLSNDYCSADIGYFDPHHIQITYQIIKQTVIVVRYLNTKTMAQSSGYFLLALN